MSNAIPDDDPDRATGGPGWRIALGGARHLDDDRGGDSAIDSVPAGGAAIATYVSLFLILFVFFIVLFSSARVERAKTQAVLASLDSAFGHLPSDLGLLPRAEAPLRPDEGFARDLGQMLGQFGALGVSAVPGADGLLSVDLPVDRLFVAGTTGLAPAAGPLIDRLAVMLQQPHAVGTDRGRRYRLDWHVALPPAPGDKSQHLSDTAGDAALEVSRGAVFAAALYARGCPGDGVAITRDIAPSAATAGLRWVFADLGAEAAQGRSPAGEGD